MNIAYVSASRIPSQYSNSVQVVKSCDAFQRLGHKVTLFHRYGTISEKPEKFYKLTNHLKCEPTRWPNVRGLGGAIYGRKTVSKIRKLNSYDLIYARDIYSAFQILDSRTYPLVFEAHTPPRNLLHKFLQSYLFKSHNFKLLITVSERLKRFYLNNFPKSLSHDKILVAPNGADLPDEKDSEYNEDEKNYRFRVGYFGSFQQHKGTELLLKLINKLPEVNFELAGHGPESIILELSNKINVNYHGHVNQNTLNKLVSNCHIVLAPYQRRKNMAFYDDTIWGSPLKIFEYMSHKKCIIASDVPACQEILTNMETGIICPSDESEKWIETIQYLKSYPSEIKQIGYNAFNNFLSRFERTKRAGNIINTIKEKL